ncbi:MAG: hypothetical protein ACYCU8_08345 [Ferrimicrobium acidiphilum]
MEKYVYINGHTLYIKATGNSDGVLVGECVVGVVGGGVLTYFTGGLGDIWVGGAIGTYITGLCASAIEQSWLAQAFSSLSVPHTVSDAAGLSQAKLNVSINAGVL